MKTDPFQNDPNLKRLIKKSVQEPSSPGFNDDLMKRIEKLPVPYFQSNGHSYLRKNCKFLLLSCFLLLISVFLQGEVLSEHIVNNNQIFSLLAGWIYFGGLALFVPVIFYHLDFLAGTLFQKPGRMKAAGYSQ